MVETHSRMLPLLDAIGGDGNGHFDFNTGSC